MSYLFDSVEGIMNRSHTMPAILLPSALAVVRNRSGPITNVTPSAVSPEGIVHLVTVSFADREGARSERVLWERDPGAKVITGAGLPRIHDDAHMSPGVFSAMVQANRWTELRPCVDPDTGAGTLSRMPLASARSFTRGNSKPRSNTAGNTAAARLKTSASSAPRVGNRDDIKRRSPHRATSASSPNSTFVYIETNYK
jgi:hypothetical protein